MRRSVRLLRACEDSLALSISEDFTIRTFKFKVVQEDFPPTAEQDPIGSASHLLDGHQSAVTGLQFAPNEDVAPMPTAVLYSSSTDRSVKRTPSI